MQADEHEQARRYLEEALRLSEQHGYNAVQAWSLRHLGDVALRNGHDLAISEGYLRQARMLAKAGGMRPELAHNHRALAALYHGAGQFDAAETERERANDLYVSLGMTFWTARQQIDLGRIP